MNWEVVAVGLVMNRNAEIPKKTPAIDHKEDEVVVSFIVLVRPLDSHESCEFDLDLDTLVTK